jgi:hypothetical protein
MGADNLFVYTAAYSNEDDARNDMEAFRDVAVFDVVGDYDTALIAKDGDGKVHVEKHGTQTTHGFWRGALAGGVIGLLFPPAIVTSGLVGGAIGAITGKLWGGMPRADLKDLGEPWETYGRCRGRRGPRQLQLYDAVLDGEVNQPGVRIDAQRFHQLVLVELHRADGNRETRGDLLGGASLGQELQDLALPRR